MRTMPAVPLACVASNATSMDSRLNGACSSSMTTKSKPRSPRISMAWVVGVLMKVPTRRSAAANLRRNAEGEMWVDVVMDRILLWQRNAGRQVANGRPAFQYPLQAFHWTERQKAAARCMAEAPVESVRRAIQLLHELNRQRVSSVRHLHHATGLPKPTIVRLLDTLIALGYVVNDRRQGGYQVTS